MLFGESGENARFVVASLVPSFLSPIKHFETLGIKSHRRHCLLTVSICFRWSNVGYNGEKREMKTNRNHIGPVAPRVPISGVLSMLMILSMANCID